MVHWLNFADSTTPPAIFHISLRRNPLILLMRDAADRPKTAVVPTNPVFLRREL